MSFVFLLNGNEENIKMKKGTGNVIGDLLIYMVIHLFKYYLSFYLFYFSIDLFIFLVLLFIYLIVYLKVLPVVTL